MASQVPSMPAATAPASDPAPTWRATRPWCHRPGDEDPCRREQHGAGHAESREGRRAQVADDRGVGEQEEGSAMRVRKAGTARRDLAVLRRGGLLAARLRAHRVATHAVVVTGSTLALSRAPALRRPRHDRGAEHDAMVTR